VQIQQRYVAKITTMEYQPFNNVPKDDVAITTRTSDLRTIVRPSNVENAARVRLLKGV